MSTPTHDPVVTCTCGEVITLLAGAFAYTECPGCPRAFYETGALIPPEDVKAWREDVAMDQQERAQLAGMEGGCEAYNDAMGCSLEGPGVGS